ncbi:MAG: hypothetical protein P8L42_04240 [Flavicella sp.]|nr:hypothetical protein [Flavicella sp.]
MSDFFQNGVITTLQNLGGRSIDDYENVRKKIEDCFIIVDTEVSEHPYTYETIN